MINSLDWQEYLKRTFSYWKDDYKGAFDEFRETGKSPWITLHDRGEIAKTCFCEMCGQTEDDYATAEEHYKDWKKVADPIRTYRNNFAHNPRLAYHIEADGQLTVPKWDKLHKYARWSDFVYRRDNADLMYLDDLMESYQTKLEQATNTLWAHLIEPLATLLPKDEHQQVPTLPAQPVVAMPGSAECDGPEPFTSPSGTTSALDPRYPGKHG